MINVKNVALIQAIGFRVRELRIANKLSQESLSQEADVPLSQIGRLERGEINPTISTLYVIAIALEIDLKKLVDIDIEYK